MSKNKKTSSEKISSQAAKTLSNPNASAIQKKLAASALAQSDPNKQTGSQMEETAAKVLKSSKYGADTKRLAGSVLSQANKSR
ncbi:MAG: hypothetical protein F6K00_27715 [Leptolyngbya sp. SIOISBB]|nr:hypothetical protein [Leptolyngbya sp. SIOISBB]